MEINPSSIIDILTLRYDPSLTPNLPKKSVNDFLPNENSYTIKYYEDIICNEIKKKLEVLDDK